jgi:hypothetical protein
MAGRLSVGLGEQPAAWGTGDGDAAFVDCGVVPLA